MRVLAGVSLSAAYWVDVATFAFALILLVRMHALVPEGGGTRAGFSSVKEGLRYLKGQRARQLIRAAWTRSMARVDCLVTPTCPVVATRFGQQTAPLPGGPRPLIRAYLDLVKVAKADPKRRRWQPIAERVTVVWTGQRAA